MCLVYNDQKTERFRVQNKNKQVVTMYKVVEVNLSRNILVAPIK